VSRSPRRSGTATTRVDSTAPTGVDDTSTTRAICTATEVNGTAKVVLLKQELGVNGTAWSY
jgi:hypothetical protein